MPDRIAASLDTLRDIKQVDNGDGSFSLAVSSVDGGGASQVEEKNGEGVSVYNSVINPLVAGFIDINDQVQFWRATNVNNAPSVFIYNNSLNVNTKPLANHVSGNASGSITTANIPQTLSSQNYNRWFFLFANLSDTDMWLSLFGSGIGAGSIRVPAGQSFTFPSGGIPANPVSVTCSASGKAFTCWEG